MADQGGLIGLADGSTNSALSTQQQAAAKAAAAQAAAGPSNSSLYNTDISTVESDLNSNNFTGAWNTALQSSGLFDKGESYSQATDQATQDPLLQAMEGGVGALDPSKNWTAAQTSSFYNAFNAEGAYHGQTVAGQGGGVESLGKNPYGLWGASSAITSGSDAKANESAAGDTPDVSRFVGQHPTTSFLGKYGADIAALALTAVTAGAAAPLAGAMLGADLGATALGVGLTGAAMGAVGTAAIDAGFGKPLTLGSVAGGALSGLGASGALGGIGSALGKATGLGSTAGGALVGAGVGAAGSALNHGNIALGALAGGVGGAIRGSGVVGQAGSTINNATGIPTSLATAGVGAGVGIGTNYALGSLASSGAAPSSGARAMPAPVSAPMSGSNGAVPSMPSMPGSSPYSTGAVGSNYNAGNFLGVGVLGTGAAVGTGATMSNGSMGIGTNGNMATSTDTSLAGTITGAIPGLLQTGAGVGGAVAAGNALSNANQNVITTQQNNLGNINSIWSTQQALGQGADTALGSALGTNGQPANYSGFENMPGYQFAVSQGTQAIQRQAAAMGNAYTPNTAAAVGQYVTGTASQDYNTYISQLMGAAGLGSTANTALQTANQNTANNISTAQQNIGAAQAGEYTSLANSAGSLFGANGAGTSLINAAGKAIGSGSSGSGGTSGSGGMSGNSGDTASGGVDPSTGIPYDIENPNSGSTPTTGYDASNPLGISGAGTTASDPNWSSVTDSTFNGSGVSDSSGLWNSVTDSGSSDIGSDATSFLGDW
jgi:hypothetical protein